MIEAIKEIGEKILSNTSPDKFLENLVEVPKKINGEEQYIVIIDFNTDEETVTFDFEEMKDDTPKKYLWIGNALSNNPQDRFTTNNLEYLISQTIPNVIEAISDGELKKLLEKVKNKFYYDLGDHSKQNKKYQYILDIEKIRISSKSIEQILEEVNNNPKKLVNTVKNEIFEYLKREKNLTKKQIGLFNLKIDNQLISDFPEYRKHLEDSLIKKLFSKTIRGRCFLCQKEKEVTKDMRFKFSYYITDKISFASELEEKGFLKNFTLCEECYKKILVGESFIKNKMRTKVGLNLYIIPQFIFGDISFPIKKLDKWAEYIKQSLNSVVNLEGLRKFQDRLEEYSEFQQHKNNFILNLLYYRKYQSEFKILKLILDVPPSRLDFLKEKENEIYEIAKKIFGEDNRWYLNLERMYYLFPVRISKQEIGDYKKVLDFYDAIFSTKSISYKFLIKQFVDLIGVYRFGKFDSYNIKKPKDTDTGLIYSVLEANLLLLYLKKLKLLQRGGDNMNNIDTSLLSEGMKKYIEEMGYGEEQSALFLLGYLIGEIGNAQWSKENPNKPILNKLVYQGMDVKKILRLTNEVFEKLKQYKRNILYNEQIFAECKRLLDKNLNNWQLSNQENVFYILSGYAYNMLKKIDENKLKENKNEEVENE
ncbi:MAG TPA: TIGR02556 family CRISPR-associated protein [bacterium]|nr:TIGR02556 family CRISPR-associated protein [bacterium]